MLELPDIESQRPRWLPKWLWEFAYVASGQYDRDLRMAIIFHLLNSK